MGSRGAPHSLRTRCGRLRLGPGQVLAPWLRHESRGEMRPRPRLQALLPGEAAVAGPPGQDTPAWPFLGCLPPKLGANPALVPSGEQVCAEAARAPPSAPTLDVSQAPGVAGGGERVLASTPLLEFPILLRAPGLRPDATMWAPGAGLGDRLAELLVGAAPKGCRLHGGPRTWTSLRAGASAPWACSACTARFLLPGRAEQARGQPALGSRCRGSTRSLPGAASLPGELPLRTCPRTAPRRRRGLDAVSPASAACVVLGARAGALPSIAAR